MLVHMLTYGILNRADGLRDINISSLKKNNI